MSETDSKSEEQLNEANIASSSSNATEIKVEDSSEQCANDAFKFTTLDVIHSRKFRE